MTSVIFASPASAQGAATKDFTYSDAVAAIRSSGYKGPLTEHPAIITHVKQEAGPKFAPFITQLQENIKVDVKFEYGTGNQTHDFKPYKVKPLILHAMGVNADAPVMEDFMTLGETLDILDIPDIRNTAVKISTPRKNNGDTPELTVRVGQSNQGVKLEVSEDIYTYEIYVITGLAYEDLMSVHINGKILDAKTLHTF